MECVGAGKEMRVILDILIEQVKRGLLLVSTVLCEDDEEVTDSEAWVAGVSIGLGEIGKLFGMLEIKMMRRNARKRRKAHGTRPDLTIRGPRKRPHTKFSIDIHPYGALLRFFVQARPNHVSLIM